MKLRLAVLAVAVYSLSLAGQIVYPGFHPNYDVQIINSLFLTTPFLSVETLNIEFPQWDYVEVAPNVIGFLDSSLPSRPIVWTTLINQADEEALAAMAEKPVNTADVRRGRQDSGPPAQQTPEPQTMALLGTGLLAVAWRIKFYSRCKK